MKQLDHDIFGDWDYTLAALDFYLAEVDDTLHVELDEENLLSLRHKLQQVQENVDKAIQKYGRQKTI